MGSILETNSGSIVGVLTTRAIEHLERTQGRGICASFNGWSTIFLHLTVTVSWSTIFPILTRPLNVWFKLVNILPTPDGYTGLVNNLPTSNSYSGLVNNLSTSNGYTGLVNNLPTSDGYTGQQSSYI